MIGQAGGFGPQAWLVLRTRAHIRVAWAAPTHRCARPAWTEPRTFTTGCVGVFCCRRIAPTDEGSSARGWFERLMLWARSAYGLGACRCSHLTPAHVPTQGRSAREIAANKMGTNSGLRWSRCRGPAGGGVVLRPWFGRHRMTRLGRRLVRCPLYRCPDRLS